VSFDPKYGRHCDECGKALEAPYRRRGRFEYCRPCYQLVFIKAQCSLCEKSIRVHRWSNETHLCNKCSKTDRTCLRCGKLVPQAGMIVEGEPVCPSCSPYFREKRACANCGQLSSRLARQPSMGVHEPWCDSCRTKLTHTTCSICRRHRKTAGNLSDGRPVCKSCLPGVEESHACPDCGRVLAGTGFGRCRSCNNLKRIRHEVECGCITFQHEWVGDVYRLFGDWYHSRHPDNPTVVRTFKPHGNFFEELDRHFNEPSMVTPEGMLRVFGTDGLRRYLLSSRFLEQSLTIPMTTEQKLEHAERHRIQATIENAKGTVYEELVAGCKIRLNPSGQFG
jgi:hypothetical protein